VRVFGQSVRRVRGVAAGQTLGPRPGPSAARGQALLEALRGEVVDHGVQAAVEAGQAQGDGVKSSGEALHAAVIQGLRPHQGVQEEDGVIGHEADDEDGQVDQNHPEDALLAVAAVTDGHRTPQRSQNERGAYQVGQEGEKEAHNLGMK